MPEPAHPAQTPIKLRLRQRVLNCGFIGDRVALEDGISFVAANRHSYDLRDASLDHVAAGAATKIVRLQATV